MTNFDVTDGATETGAAFAAGAAAVELREVEVDGVRIAVVPAAWRAEVLDVEAKMAHPRRKTGTVTARTVQSFVDYVKRHKSEATIAFAADTGVVTAVLDHHEPVFADEGGDTAAAGWGQHRAVLQRPQTPAFKAWTGANGRPLSQLQFAEFLEDRMREVVEPNGADLFELAKFFQASQNVSFSSARNLANGEVQLHYVEELDGRNGAGDRGVPTQFVVRLQPYADSEAFDLAARLRWRLADGKVSFVFHLDEQLVDLLDEEHEKAVATVEEQTEITVVRGTLS